MSAVSTTERPSRRVRSVGAALDALRTDGAIVAGGRGSYATGFDPLDSVLGGGLEPGGLTVLAGGPGRGKTICALQWARQVALDGDVGIFVCFEHPELTILARLLSVEVGELIESSQIDDPLRVDDIRSRMRALGAAECSLIETAAADPLLAEAVERARGYADRLVIVPESGSTAERGGFARLVDSYDRCALFVDYLQKVHLGGTRDNDEDHIRQSAEHLKDLAMDRGIAVVAVSAADQSGLSARRLAMHHLRGASATAYEADVVIMLNEKLGAVSRAHIAYDTTRYDEFRQQTVFSIEKNRSGESNLDLEFKKDFGHYRFKRDGRFVGERLWREGEVD